MAMLFFFRANHTHSNGLSSKRESCSRTKPSGISEKVCFALNVTQHYKTKRESFRVSYFQRIIASFINNPTAKVNGSIHSNGNESNEPDTAASFAIARSTTMVCAKSPAAQLISPVLCKRSGRKFKKRNSGKRNVRFDLQQNRDAISHSESTWLSPKEYRSIRRELELTIVLLEQTPDDEKSMLPPRFCSRGLENFRYAETISTRNMAICPKPEALSRRKLVISSVLKEQESQRRLWRHDSGIKSKERSDENHCKENDDEEERKQQQKPPLTVYNDGAIRRACLLRTNRENTMRAIERALEDAEQAEGVYKEWIDAVKTKIGEEP